MNAQTQPTSQAAGTAAVHPVREADRQPATQPEARWPVIVIVVIVVLLGLAVLADIFRTGGK